MNKRGRITVSLDQELIDTAEASVAAGQVASVSAWVAMAMTKQADYEAQMAALTDAIEMWESEFGEITEQTMVDAERLHGRRGTVVSAGKAARPRKSRSFSA